MEVSRVSGEHRQFYQLGSLERESIPQGVLPQEKLSVAILHATARAKQSLAMVGELLHYSRCLECNRLFAIVHVKGHSKHVSSVVAAANILVACFAVAIR